MRAWERIIYVILVVLSLAVTIWAVEFRYSRTEITNDAQAITCIEEGKELQLTLIGMRAQMFCAARRD